jgi:hypothetical protein
MIGRWVSLRSLVFSLALWTVAPAMAQDVPPPPKPADNGPSLAETMKYIQDRLNGRGEIRYQSYIASDEWLKDNPLTSKDLADLPAWWSQTLSGVKADPVGCALTWTQTLTLPGNPRGPEISMRVSFRETDKLVVELAQDWLNSGLPGYKDGAPYPPSENHYYVPQRVFVVKLALIGKGSKDWYPYFFLPDEDTANRLAKAMVHAVELCGGGDKDPFK